MRKTLTLTLLLFSSLFINAQENIALKNYDLESNIAPRINNSNTNTDFNLPGFSVFIGNNFTNEFNYKKSGLAPGEGVDGSQALKTVIQNTTGKTFHILLRTEIIDVSNRPSGSYTYTFFVKATNTPKSNKPFWIVAAAYDKKGNFLSSDDSTITPNENGGAQNIEGITEGFVEQSITFTFDKKVTKKIRLSVQIAKEDNTYLFDNFSLTGPSI